MSTSNKEKSDFSKVFNEFKKRSRLSIAQLERGSGIPRETLKNWLEGTIAQPQRWQDIIKVSAAMKLNKSDTNILLNFTKDRFSFEKCQELAPNEDKMVQKAIDEISSTEMSFGGGSGISYPLEFVESLKNDITDLHPKIQLLTAILSPDGRIGKTLDNPLAYQDGTPKRVLNTLPTMPVPLIGRQAITKKIIDRITDSSAENVICLRGFGGIGKSSLAIDVGHSCKKNFPGGRYFLNLRNKDIRNLLFNFLEELGYSSTPQLYDDDIESLCKIVRGVLANVPERVLLILDNTEVVAEDIVEQLYLSPPHMTIVTTRNRLQKINSANDFFVEPLSEQDSLDLLASKGLDVVSQRTEALAIVRLLKGVPLALELAAVSMPSKISCSQLLYELTKDGVISVIDILKMENPDSPERSVAASFALSLTNLSKEQKRLLFALSLCPPSGSTTQIVAHMCGYRSRLHEAILVVMSQFHLNRYARGIPVDTRPSISNRIITYLWNVNNSTQQQVYQLANKSLLQIDSERIALHPLLREFLINLLFSEKSHEEIMRAMGMRYVLHCAFKVGEAFTSKPASSLNTNSFQSLDDIRDNLEWAQQLSANAFMLPLVPLVMRQYWLIRDSPEAVEWMIKSQQKATSLAKLVVPMRKYYMRLAAVFANDAGAFYGRRGDTDNAIKSLHDAIQFAEKGENIYLCSLVYYQLSELYIVSGEIDKALESIEAGTAFITNRNNIRFKLAAAFMKARSFDLKNDMEKALEQFELALSLIPASEKYEGMVPEAIILRDYARTLSQLGQRDKAEENFSKALRTTRLLGWNKLEAYVLVNLSEHYYRNGDIELSKQKLINAADLFAKVGDVVDEGKIRARLGYINDNIEEITQGITLMESDSIDKTPGKNSVLAFANHQLGWLLLQSERKQDARLPLQKAYDGYLALGEIDNAEKLEKLLMEIE